MTKVAVLFMVIAGTTALHDPVSKKNCFSFGHQRSLDDNESLHLFDTAKSLNSFGYNPDIQNSYYVYTRANPTAGQRLSKDVDIRSTNFNANKRSVVIIHGWQESLTASFNTVLVEAILRAADVNVIIVDWSAGATGEYMIAVRNTSLSGAAVARFLRWLNQATGASIRNYHIVGSSLGGQQAGIVGRNLGGQVPYITALDPAGPAWMNNPDRLRKTDGLYTEVIHTNAGSAGYPIPLGHVDFYPNGGSKMPGCDTDLCNHFRSFYYFAESVKSGGFLGTRCDSLVNAQRGHCSSADKLSMGGLRAKTGSSGIFYLVTNPSSPYSRH